MPSFIDRYLRNTNFLFLTAFLLGLAFGDYASSLKGYILPALVLIMSLSTTKITLSELIHFKRYIRDIFLVFLVNYIFLSGLILLANHLLSSSFCEQSFKQSAFNDHHGFAVSCATPNSTETVDESRQKD